jgi:hypothetical protein
MRRGEGGKNNVRSMAFIDFRKLHEAIQGDVLKIRKGQIIRGENIKLLERQQEPWTSR